MSRVKNKTILLLMHRLWYTFQHEHNVYTQKKKNSLSHNANLSDTFMSSFLFKKNLKDFYLSDLELNE